MSLFAELKRRNVIRVAIAYLAVAWLILQVADVVLGNFDAPRSVFQFLIVILAFGLPFAVVFAWIFELTPEGIKRESDVDRSVSIASRTGRKLDMAIIAVLSTAVIFLLADRFMGQSDTESITSIAVLPFANRSTVVDDIHFVDGIHDDILTLLANMSGFDKVISRTSVERYRDTDMAIGDIGNELGVSAILEGGVQRAGDRVRINMQLIDPATDEHLWAETYEREATVESLFAVQSEISREVVAALHIALTSEDEERLDRIPTDSLEAYNEFVLGRQQMALRTAAALDRALVHFERAVELDPEYVLAHVGIADVLALLGEYSNVGFEPLYDRRQEVIETALGLDPTSGEAYAALGLLQHHRGQREEAEASYLRSIELSPNYSSSYHWYSNILNTDERREESLRVIRRAVELDPAAPVLKVNLANRLHLLGRFEEARQVTLDGLQLNPSFPTLYRTMAGLLTTQGRIGEAAAWTDRAVELNPLHQDGRFFQCGLQLQLGNPEAARSCIEGVQQDFPAVPEFRFIWFEWTTLVLEGEYDAAVAYAEAAAARDPENVPLMALQAAAYLGNGQFDEARPFYETFFPQYFSDEELTLMPSELQNAVQAAATMRDGDGWSERARYVAGAALETMQSMHRTRGVGYLFLDVPAHGIRGEMDQGLAALRDAVDSGWRDGWWNLRTPAYPGEELGPEWNAMIAELEADIAEQRRWYQENRDEPLF